jgi:hypothetical protein
MPLPIDPFDVKNLLFSGKSLIVLKLASVSGYTGATDTITKTAHGLTVGRTVAFVSGTGWTGLTAGTVYYVVATPTTDTFKISATTGGAAITVGTSTGGVFEPVEIFGSKILTSKAEQEEKAYEYPDASGITREVRTVLTKQAESFTFSSGEVKRISRIFGGGLAGRVTGKATLYCPDPDDASGTVAMKSEADFPATITRDGDVQIGNSEFSEVTLNLKSNKLGTIVFTPDAIV